MKDQIKHILGQYRLSIFDDEYDDAIAEIMALVETARAPVEGEINEIAEWLDGQPKLKAEIGDISHAWVVKNVLEPISALCARIRASERAKVAGWKNMSDLGPDATLTMKSHLLGSRNYLAVLFQNDERPLDVVVERSWDNTMGTRYFVLPDVPASPEHEGGG